MEFAEWVVSGLDQSRLGQLSDGEAFFNTVWGRLGSDPRLSTFLNVGDPGSRAALVSLIEQTVRVDPAFEQQVRAAAPGTGVPGVAKPNFFKTTAGAVTLIVLAIAVIGGGVGLALGLSGGGSVLAEALKGTWSCSSQKTASTASLVIGDGTWSVGSQTGTWKQDGGTVTLTDTQETDPLIVTGVPASTGSVKLTVASGKSADGRAQVTGTVSAHSMNLTVFSPTSGKAIGTITCTK